MLGGQSSVEASDGASTAAPHHSLRHASSVVQEQSKFPADERELCAEMLGHLRMDCPKQRLQSLVRRWEHIISGHESQHEVNELRAHELVHLLAVTDVRLSMPPLVQALLQVLGHQAKALRKSTDDPDSDSDSDSEPDTACMLRTLDLLALALIKAYAACGPLLSEADVQRVVEAVGPLLGLQVPLFKVLAMAAAASTPPNAQSSSKDSNDSNNTTNNASNRNIDKAAQIAVTYKVMRVLSKVRAQVCVCVCVCV